jgi:hypothetical protein
MKSFIVKLSEFFCIARNVENTESFDDGIIQYVIPKYQREYKWTEEKVTTLVNDINNRDKFLGNIILDKKDRCYEIVDGQQRITTVFLILIALFNILKNQTGQGINLEQDNILGYLKKENAFVLKNQTIGEFLVLDQNSINIDINDDFDVYFQKDTFITIYDIILAQLNRIEDKGSFVQKLLDCSFLILISSNTGYTTSIEQIFLDINFKSQLLDVEDIFKGYCFKNYWPQYHDELKEQWVKLKKNSRTFLNFGYKDMSEFLYHYLLSKPESYEIPQRLSPGGTHYLEGKNNNETKRLLDDMVDYSQNITSFWNCLNNDVYIFLDLCPDLSRYRNTQEHIVMKKMCKNIIESRAAQYHKFPFLMMVHFFKKDVTLGQGVLRADFKKLITNYYIYSFLFINDNKRKQKGSIDHTIFNILYDDIPQKQRRIIEAIKLLRNNYLNNYSPSETFNLEDAYALYSIIDFYISSDNFLPKLYSLDTGFNREHLIVHDNRGQRVIWVDDNNNFEFELNTVEYINKFKKSTINYLIINEQINASLGHNDIVTKISQIEDEFQDQMPKHIALFVDHIKQMPSFIALQALKGQAADQPTIINSYHNFLTDYFGDGNQELMLQKINDRFRASFRNQT